MSSAEDNKKPKQPFVSKYTKGYRWEPTKIEYEATDEELTAGGGISNLVDLFSQTSQYRTLREWLPERNSNSSYDTVQYAMLMLASFWYGHDSLDDIAEEWEEEPGIERKLGEIPTAKSIGNWLRDFEESHLRQGEDELLEQAIAYRRRIAPQGPVVIDLDSTPHVQHGSKIEGVGPHYKIKGELCYESLTAYDEHGFVYATNLRSGNVFSSEGAAEMLDRVFRAIGQDEVLGQNEIIFRGDSAFARQRSSQFASLGK